jgi:hypothetical protein
VWVPVKIGSMTVALCLTSYLNFCIYFPYTWAQIGTQDLRLMPLRKYELNP